MKNSDKQFRSWKALLFGILFSILFLSGCQGSDQSLPPGSDDQSASAGPVRGGDLKIGISTDGVFLGDPAKIRSTTDLVISNTALETLGRYDESGNLHPFLAESWEIDEENLTIVVQLKEGIKFHDGTEFNAETAAWNLQHFLDGKREDFSEKVIQKIEATGDREVTVTLFGLNGKNITTMFTNIRFVSKEAFETNGAEWAEKNPIGTGPFKLDKWAKGTSIHFVKNEDYWQDGLPYLDSVQWKVIADEMTAESSLRVGDIDLIWGAASNTAQKMESDFNVKKLLTGLGNPGTGIIFDSANSESPFADARVRQAVSYAIDRDTIADSIFNGYSKPTFQWSSQDAWSYNPDIQLKFDPEKAKSLLAEAGYPDGFKTKLGFSTTPEQNLLYAAVQGYLSEVGIEAELEPMSSSRWQELTRTTWDGMLHFGFRAEADVTEHMAPSLAKKDEGGTWSANIIHPEELEKLMDESSTLIDKEDKRQASFELQRLALEEYAIAAPILVKTNPSILNKKVRNDGFNDTHAVSWTPEEVWVGK